MFKKEIRGPIGVLFCISLGGLMLHVKIHPVGATPFNWIPLGAGLVTTFGLPFLFNYRRTMPWAYMLNLAAVILGTVTMAYFTVTNWQGSVTAWTVIMGPRSTAPDIIILLAKIPLGQMILRHFYPRKAALKAQGDRK